MTVVGARAVLKGAERSSSRVELTRFEAASTADRNGVGRSCVVADVAHKANLTHDRVTNPAVGWSRVGADVASEAMKTRGGVTSPAAVGARAVMLKGA